MASSMNWVDGPAGGTPINAANLNKLAVVADVAASGTPTGDALKVAYGLTVAATVTASGALVVGKHNPVDATAGALTMTLPTGAIEGASLGVEKVDSSANVLTVTGNVRGLSGQSISLPWTHETLVLRADSTGSWWPVAGHKTKTALDAAYAPVAQGFLEGSGAPSNALGVNGQMYFDYTNSVLYGPKTTGAWGSGLSLTGTSVSINSSLRGDVAPSPASFPMSSAGRGFSAGRTFLVRYVPSRPRALTLAAISVNTAATVNDPVEVGIYTAGATLTRVATSGQQSGLLNATGVKTPALTYSVDPSQTYYVAIATATVGGTSASIAGLSVQTADSFLAYGAGQPNALFGLIDGALSAGLLPATIAASSVTWGGLSTAPAIVLREV